MFNQKKKKILLKKSSFLLFFFSGTNSLSCYICGDSNLDEFGECSKQFQYDCSPYAKRFPATERIFCRTTRHKEANSKWRSFFFFTFFYYLLIFRFSSCSMIRKKFEMYKKKKLQKYLFIISFFCLSIFSFYLPFF